MAHINTPIMHQKQECTLMKSVFSQLSSFTASGTGTSLPSTVTVAWPTSGNWVEEWFPQMMTLRTSWDETPTRVPIWHGNRIDYLHKILFYRVMYLPKLLAVTCLLWYLLDSATKLMYCWHILKSQCQDNNNNNNNTRSSIACLTYMSRHALQINLS